MAKKKKRSSRAHATRKNGKRHKKTFPQEQSEEKRGRQPYRLRLDEVDRRMLFEKTRQPSLTMAELGTLIGYSESQVFNRFQNVAFKEALEQLQKDALTLLRDIEAESIRTLSGLMRKSTDENIRLRASVVLSRSVLKKAQESAPPSKPRVLIIKDDN